MKIRRINKSRKNRSVKKKSTDHRNRKSQMTNSKRGNRRNKQKEENKTKAKARYERRTCRWLPDGDVLCSGWPLDVAQSLACSKLRLSIT